MSKYFILMIIALCSVIAIPFIMLAHDSGVAAEKWERTLYESYMEKDCESLEERYHEALEESKDYWLSSVNPKLVKAYEDKCKV